VRYTLHLYLDRNSLLLRFVQSTVLNSCNSTLLARPTESFPVPPHEGILGAYRYRSTHSQPRRYMESSRQLHSPTFTPGDEPRYPLDRMDGPHVLSGRFGGERSLLSLVIQIRSVARPMNTVGGADCSAGACIYRSLYVRDVLNTYSVCACVCVCVCARARARVCVQGDTKKRELLKNRTKIEEIQQKKIIDRN